MSGRTRSSRGGFSLVEMLVVIAILGILASLILPAVWRAVVRAREARIILEVSQLDMALESYRQNRGAYPPSGFQAENAAADEVRIEQYRRHLRRAFPRHQHDDSGDGALAQLIAARLTPAESLVFWLAQVVNDPRRPLTSDGDRQALFDFDESRLRRTREIPLGDRDDFPLFEYLPPGSDAAAYVYFPAPYAVAVNGDPVVNFHADELTGFDVYPYRSNRGDLSDLTAIPLDDEWLNPTTFQLIAPGLDGEFGEDTVGEGLGFKVYPNALNYTEGDWDNIANFTDGRTFVDSME